MTAFTRRQLFAPAAIVPLALALDACGPLAPNTSPTPVPIITQLADDVATLASGLRGALSGLTGIVSTATLTKLQGYVSEAATIAQQVAAAGSGSVSSIVSGLPAIISGIASTIGVSLPPAFQMALQAAQVLLPVIMAAAGIAFAQAAPTGMSVAQARAVLKAMAVR